MDEDLQRTSRRVLTIGHSNHSMDHFLQLLRTHGVEVVIDTRSQPRSAFAPHFNGPALKEALRGARMKYVYLGRELGGRPDGSEFYDEAGHVLYSKVAESSDFQSGISRVQKGIEKYSVALLCAEENPAPCHRRLLVGRVLDTKGIAVDHIRGDGSIQSEHDLALKEESRQQMALFQRTELTKWKSIQSVLPKRRQNSSSAF
jgi:uncharacterized protein (DUF488 family)